MDNCSKHPKEIPGFDNMNELAIKISELNYETLAEFLERLTDKLFLDAAKDKASGKEKLSDELNHAANCIYYAHINIETAYEISKPFMETT